MAAPKRNDLEREAQLPEIEKLHNRGWSSRRIAAHFGLSHPTILRDLGTITQRYREETLAERQEGVNRQLAALLDIREQAWEAWEKSKEDRGREVRETVQESLGADGKPTAKTVARMKEVLSKEGRLPGSEYLAIILRTYEHERSLLGLEADRTLNLKGELALQQDAQAAELARARHEQTLAVLEKLCGGAGGGDRLEQDQPGGSDSPGTGGVG